MGEITSCAEKEGIDMVCIHEHRIFRKEINTHHHKMGRGWMLLTSSAEKGSNNAAIRGVGILLSLKGYQALNKIESINARTLIASFNGNLQSMSYAVTVQQTLLTKIYVKDFYYDLTELVKAIPKHNLIAIGGDFNARLGMQNQTNDLFI